MSAYKSSLLGFGQWRT